MKLFDDFEEKIFGSWSENITAIIHENMQKPLLLRNEKGFLELNFDSALEAALKEVKLMKSIERTGIPELALDFFSLSTPLYVSRFND